MHCDVKAVRIQKYQAIVSLSSLSDITLRWLDFFFLLNTSRLDNDKVKNGNSALLCSLCSSCLA